jgi:hypothetical protein
VAGNGRLFIAIARTEDIDRYRAHVDHEELGDVESIASGIDYRRLRRVRRRCCRPRRASGGLTQPAPARRAHLAGREGPLVGSGDERRRQPEREHRRTARRPRVVRVVDRHRAVRRRWPIACRRRRARLLRRPSDEDGRRKKVMGTASPPRSTAEPANDRLPPELRLRGDATTRTGLRHVDA